MTEGERLIEVLHKEGTWFRIRIARFLIKENDNERGYLCPFCPTGYIFPVKEWVCPNCKAFVTKVWSSKTFQVM